MRTQRLGVGKVPVILLIAACVSVGACSPSVEQPVGTGTLTLAPFVVEGQTPDAGFVAGAFTDSLELHLGRTFGFELVDASRSPTLEGVVLRDESTVAARLRMIDSTGKIEWEQTVDADGTGLSGLAFRVAKAVADRLGVGPPAVYRYIENVTGGPAMAASPELRAVRAAEHDGDPEARIAAADRLVGAFPEDAASWVLAAWAPLLAWDREPTAERLTAVRERLLALERVDPGSPYDEFILGYVYRSSGEPEKAWILYDRLLDRDDLSDAARSWALRQSAYTQIQAGHHEVAQDAASRAVELDPANAANFIVLSRSLEDLGRLDEAIEASERALALEPFAWRHWQRLGLVLSRAGRVAESREALARACEMGRAQEACANTAVIMLRAGRDDQGQEMIRLAATLTDTAWGRYNLACASALADRPEIAVDNLRRALDLGFADVLIDTDPDLDSLRGDPRFEAVRVDVAQRLQSRRAQSNAIFPWQG